MPAFFSPAKINLFLAITGQRGDGYHELVSVVAPLDFGDDLSVEASRKFSLECDDPDVPIDDGNLIIKAAKAFVEATKWTGGAHFRLTKRIPMGAGLGGGSSNAVAALRALNHLAGYPASEARLEQVAAGLGSDCVLFLKNRPVVMRGRGEKAEVLPTQAIDRLVGRRVLLFKPSFSIGTAWAYRRMVERKTDYVRESDAEARVKNWMNGAAPAEELLFNNMEGVAFEKFVALPLLLEKLRGEFGIVGRMSGSGSACYALPGENQPIGPLEAVIRSAWGRGALVHEARITQSSALTG